MTWIKLDDQAVDHPKVANLSDRAFRWWVKGLSYASRFLTNGFLPAVFVRQVPKKSQDELTAPNLWTPKDDGMEIHDYLAHQSSKEAVTQKRAVTADRVKRYREGKRNAVTESVTASECNAVSNAHVTAPENREQRTEFREQKEQVPRAPAQSRGAFEPGSLPRDHMHHAICGPSLRICLKVWECGELMRQFGGDPSRQKAAVVGFVEVLEKSLGPDDSIGPFNWIEKHFQTWLHSIGRAPVAPAKPQKPAPRGVAELLAEAEAKKAARAS